MGKLRIILVIQIDVPYHKQTICLRAPAQFFFCPFPLGDITRDAKNRYDPAAGIHDGRKEMVKPADLMIQ